MREERQTATEWSPLEADCAARIYGIRTLDDRHWAAIAAIREEYLRTGKPPDISTICSTCGLLCDELVSLFPNPCTTLYALAGVPAPGALDDIDPARTENCAERLTNLPSTRNEE